VERQKRWLLQDFGLGAFSGVTPYPDEETLQARKSLAARNEVTLKAQAKGKEPPPVSAYACYQWAGIREGHIDALFLFLFRSCK
jgi:hypothetical protein